jgi:hypothetical protein
MRIYGEEHMIAKGAMGTGAMGTGAMAASHSRCVDRTGRGRDERVVSVDALHWYNGAVSSP